MPAPGAPGFGRGPPQSLSEDLTDGKRLSLIIAICIQFAAAFLAFRLVWITKRKTAWIFIATAILLMAVRRCFTLYEWFIREMSLLPVDIGTELWGWPPRS